MERWRFFFWIFVAGMLVQGAACRPSSSQSGPAPDASGSEVPDDGLSARDILAATRSAYARAAGYSDSGLLYLSYRLHGNRIQEQQPWQVTFQRPNRLAGKWYNANVRCDGSRLGCYVYDIETANLDNQWLVLDAVEQFPVGRLLADPMAWHFLAGESELPLRKGGADPEWTLVPPVVGLLTGEQKWRIWEHPDVAVRLADALVDNRPCYHIQLAANGLQSEWWIDQEHFLVRQMTLPAGLLDPAIQSSGEVDELQFFARLHDCRFLPPQDPQVAGEFGVSAPASARPVRHFVPLPEEFPSELVGQAVPPLTLGSFGQGASAAVDLSAGPVPLIWAPVLIDEEFLRRVAELTRGIAPTKPWVVLGPQHFQNGAIPGTPFPDVVQAAGRLDDTVEWMTDPESGTWKGLKLRSSLATAVVDQSGILQYAGHLGNEEWPEELAAAVLRVQAGEDVAAEMRTDYGEYLETYHRRLKMVAADDSIREGEAAPGPDRVSMAAVVGKPLWSNREIRSPGNLVPLDGGRIIALDGWRSVVELDVASGSVLKRKELDLPPGAAVNRLRSLTTDNGPIWAAFSVSGAGLFLFDRDWNRIGTIVGQESENRDRILDCRFSTAAKPGDPNPEPVLKVAFSRSGLKTFRPDWTTPESTDGRRAEQFADIPEGVLALNDGVLTLAGSDDNGPAGPVPGVSGIQQVTGLVGFPAFPVESTVQYPLGQDDGRPVAVAVGLAEGQVWVVSLLHSGQRRGLQAMTGPQLFGNAVEPLCVDPLGGWVASADSQGQVRVFDRQLREIGRVAVREVSGHCLVRNGTAGILLTSQPGNLSAWPIGEMSSTQTGTSGHGE